MAVRVGVGWATHFSRSGIKRLQYRRLRYAYRAPSFFLQGMIARGDNLEFVEFDEDLTSTDLNGPAALAPQVDVLYIASHGMTSNSGYQLALHGEDWTLMASTFGSTGPAVVIFDTCNLVDLRRNKWEDDWRTSAIGSALRLVLGFSSPATVSQPTSIRGSAFATELDRLPVAEAWYASIQSTSYVGTDRPFAIAFGEDDNDAQNILDTARIDALPGPRTSAIPGIAWGPP